VTYHETKDAVLPNLGSLAALAAAMKSGAVQTLVILGGNPVFDAPVDLEFASALGKVPHSIALGQAVDETSSKTEWRIPQAHFLESWGDARAVGGTVSVIQPLILPLFDGKSAVEVLGLMATGTDRPGYDIVRETWTPMLGQGEFDQKWNRVLHDGLLAGSELPAVVPAATPAPFAELGRPDGSGSLEIVFLPSSSLHDGRFANNGWLQELPDPLTKLTWDNPALMSPKTAETSGLENGEVARLEYSGRSLDVPVWILPGMADGVVALTLGYGRQLAGRIGNGVGFDTFTVRSSQAPGFASGVTLSRRGGRHPLSATQNHGSMEGRPIVRESTLAEHRSRASGHTSAAGAHGTASPLGVYPTETPHFSLWKEHTYDQGVQWGMTIDLNACIGCNACMTACQSENNVPVVGKAQVANGREMHWLRVDRYFSGEPSGSPEVVFQPVPCMHCEDAPCEQVCPVAATVHDAQGLNVMVYNRCIGTRYCSNNCPYKVRRFNFFNFTKDTPDVVRLAMNPDVTVRSRGVMEKCTYCTQRINQAKIDAKLAGREIRDGDVKTACQQACPASAIEFGNLRDASSRVVKAKADPRNYALLDELNTKPRTTYLAKVRNPNPEIEGATT
jgi:molybdopterin-containing oxidoreductase family iron-sulfur binding subunit